MAEGNDVMVTPTQPSGLSQADSRGTQCMLPVYVVHYDAPEWCRDTVRSLLTSDVPLRVTVVHNGGALPDLQRESATVALMDRNLGYTGGANWAIADSEPTDYLVVASHDLIVRPTTISALLAAAQQHPDAGVLGAAVGSFGDLLDEDDRVEWREWTSGSCLLLRRACLEQIGEFDERLHSYGDDEDLGIRAWSAGWRVGRVLDAVASHRGSAIGESRRERLIMRNRVLLARKHSGMWGVARVVVAILPRRVAYHLKAAFQNRALARTRMSMAWSAIVGVLAGLYGLRSFNSRR